MNIFFRWEFQILKREIMIITGPYCLACWSFWRSWFLWWSYSFQKGKTFLNIVFISLENVYIRGVIKTFVDWCDEINTYLVCAFVGNIKQQMFYQLWKFKPNTLIIYHFIIWKLQGMVIRCSRRWIPWRFPTSLFFSVILYTLIHFWLCT